MCLLDFQNVLDIQGGQRDIAKSFGEWGSEVEPELANLWILFRQEKEGWSMAPTPRSVSSCPFLDGAREQDKQTLIVAGGMGLDLWRDVPMVQSGIRATPVLLRSWEEKRNPLLLWDPLGGGSRRVGKPGLFPTPRCPGSFSHALPVSY